MRVLALCAVVLLAVPAAGDDKPEWKRFSPKDGKCSVEMPGKPVAQPVQELKVGDGTSKLHLFILETNGGKTGYGLGFADFPAATDEVAAKALETAQAGTATALKGKVASERTMKLGKYPGREFTLDLPDGNQYRGRLFMVEGRLYQVIALGPKEFITGTDARAFLYSFELTE
jgi:hypothetical protein